MKRCIVLCRVSTQQQDLDQQVRQVRDAARAEGFTDEQIIEISTKESGVLLRAEERRGMRQLQEEIRKGDVSCVITYEISRVSRQPAELYQFRDSLLSAGVQWINLNPHMRLLDTQGNLSTESNIVLGVFAALAEQEGFLRKERLKRGKAAARESGRNPGGPIPDGFKTLGHGNIAIDEDRAPIYRELFSRYAAGESTARIADDFIARGFFRQSVVRVARRLAGALANTRYRGDHNFPVLVPHELYAAAEAVRVAKPQGKRNLEYRYLQHYPLADRLLFTRLQTPFYYNKGSRTYFSSSSSEVESSWTLSFRLVDALLWFVVKRRAETIGTDAGAAESAEMEARRLEVKIQDGARAIQSLKDEQGRANELYMKGRITAEAYDERALRLDADIQRLLDEDFRLRLRLSEMRGKPAETASIDDLGERERYELVHRMVEKVTAERQEKTVVFFEVLFDDGHVERWRASNNKRERGFRLMDGDEQTDIFEPYGVAPGRKPRKTAE